MAYRVDELAVRHLIAVPAHHRRDLSVEQRRRQDAGELPEDFQVLAGGVEDLDDGLVGHQPEQRLQVEAFGEGVDGERLLVGGELNDA